DPILVAFALYSAWLALQKARAGDAAARLFLLGITAAVLLSIPDILTNLKVLAFRPPRSQTMPVGMVVVGVAMVLAVQQQFRQARTALAAKLGEVEDLNRELRHQVAERARQLADWARAAAGAVGDSALAPGQIVDARYKVLRLLGRGGQGVVYEVERLADGRRLALKGVARFASNIAAARFAREAQIAARIADPHPVPL